MSRVGGSFPGLNVTYTNAIKYPRWVFSKKPTSSCLEISTHLEISPGSDIDTVRRIVSENTDFPADFVDIKEQATKELLKYTLIDRKF